MHWEAETKIPKHIRCVIKDKGTKENSGLYYLYIYEGNNNRCTWDYLYMDIEGAQRYALKHFSVPLNAWKQVD